MTNQKQFVANSQPVSDNDLYNHDETDKISIAAIESIQESAYPKSNSASSQTISADGNNIPASIPGIRRTADTGDIRSVANTISGTQIIQEIDTSDMEDILHRVNRQNESLIAKQEQQYKETEEARALEQDQLIASRKEEILKKRVAEEEAYRKAEEERERQLEEEAARLEMERSDSLRKKVAGVFAGFAKNDNTSANDNTTNTLPEPKEPKTPQKRPKKKETTQVQSDESLEEKNIKADKTDWEYIAKHDTLTGLLNASAYDIDLKSASLSSGIIFVDANNLKYLNDTFGHEFGDKLLSMISKMLLRYFEGEAYRIGGDEFVVITKRPEEKVKKIISNIQSSLERQTKADKTGMIYSAAIGYAYGDGKTPLEQIRAKADEKMYADKEAYKTAHPLLDKRKKEPPLNDKELEGLAYTDILTGLKNIHAFERAPFASTLTLIQIVGFDDLTRANGDKFAEIVGKCMKNDAKKQEHCYYLGNGEFCILSEQTPDVFLSTIKAKLHSLSIDIASQIMSGADTNELHLSLARDVIATPKEKPKSYNERLSAAQRQMKDTVRVNHEAVIEDDVAHMMDIVQQKGDEIIMVFMTSADFNNLFIFLDAEEFLQVAWDMGTSMDYSYVYAVYPGGALYYGADDYYSEITDLFQRIAESMSGRDVRAKEISHIEGINIFENIYIK